MRWARFLLLAATLVILLVRWPAGLTAVGLLPWWPFLLVLLLGLRARIAPAVSLSWLLGLSVDSLSLGPLGLHAFLFGLTALALARIRGHLFAAHPATQTVLALVLTLLVTLALLVRLNLAEPDFRLPGHVPAAVLLSLLTGAAFPLVASLDLRLGLTEGFREGERLH